ncbi:HD-GYP domain-containing protein [Kordiimonas aquimaris]|uniref:HD-GYP domain-containing protein n=1 Tax=Kordiimonas aquimaris TaxID=707591 RepID=UPI0021CE4388|nr:HD domain-containing phosphohydrolase [Kordiimonas aquimaris]
MLDIDAKLSPEFEKAVECLVRTHEAVDKYTACHGSFVGVLVEVLATTMGASNQGARTLNYASRLHDIGKISLEQNLLHAPRALSIEERNQVKGHSLEGANILKPNNTPFFDLAADIAATHHEYADGSGYPYGLSGEQISLAAKIVTFCDVYEALRARRSYKEGMSHSKVVTILTKGDDRVSTKMFDIRVLQAFVKIEKFFEEMYDDMTHTHH